MIGARRRLAVLVVVAASVVSASGCTATVGGRGRPAAAPTGVPSGPSPQGQDPAGLLAHARDSLAHVFGFEVSGSLTFAGRTAVVDLAVGPGGGHGSVTTPSGTSAVLDYSLYGLTPGGTASGLYMTASAAYWTGVGIDAADAARYAGHEVSVPSSSPFAAVRGLVIQEELTQLVFTAVGPLSGPTVRTSPVVDGQAAWVVDSGGADPTRVTLMSTGQGFPLRIDGPRASLRFGRFGVDPEITSPSGTPLSLPDH